MQDNKNKPSRRGFFFGAAATGVGAAAFVALPSATLPEPVLAELKPAPINGGGYSLSDHVKRYYETTRV